ncbi:MAG: hypothetical protein WKF96_05050, partial [Solirubrobacteraceae bacterium]
LPPDTSPADAEGLARMARHLEAGRPAPAPEFRGGLGRAVEGEAGRRRTRPRPPARWKLVGGRVTLGSLLLAVAAAQV